VGGFARRKRDAGVSVVTRPVRLAFDELWAGFDPHDNWFLDLLRPHFPIESTGEPDYLVYSPRSTAWKTFTGVRIFYTGENVRPDMRTCDWAFSFDHLHHDRHLRLPLYRLYYAPDRFIRAGKPAPSADALLNRKFCNFVYSNHSARERVQFFELLSRYKRIDAGGAVCNNMDHKVGDKVAFLGEYKFTIAFENASHPGYTTEKLADPMVAHSLPVYWGNPMVHLDFNPASFVDVTPLGSLEEGVERVIELDRDDEHYLRVMAEPWLHGDTPNQWMDETAVLDQFARIFAADASPVARRVRERARALVSRARGNGRRGRVGR
jgi:hypothetical protein